MVILMVIMDDHCILLHIKFHINHLVMTNSSPWKDPPILNR